MRVHDGPFAGWEQSEGDPFEDVNGPFYYRRDDDGRYRCAFRAERRHCNGMGPVHGGQLMAFADFAMFHIARPQLEGIDAVTVTLDSELTSPAEAGELIEATGEVLHETARMVFVRGTVFTGERTLLAFQGVLKKLRPRD